MELARIGNKYLADTEPWKLIKEDKGRTETILNIVLQISSNLSILCEPFLPFTSVCLSRILNTESKKWNKAGSVDLLAPDHQLNESELLFEKIEDEVVKEQVNKLLETKKMNEQESNSPDLTPLKNENRL